MDRKGTLVAVGLGCSLLVVEALLALLVGIIMRTPLLQWTRIVPIFASVGQIGVAYFWLRLLRHPEPPLRHWLRVAIRTAGVLYVLVVIAVIIFVGAVLWVVVALVVNVVAAVYLFRRPRLLLVWATSALAQAILLVIAVFIMFPGEEALFATYYLLLPENGLVLGTIVGLPFAWLWVKRGYGISTVGRAHNHP
jgi:hypothetical protein